MIDERKIEEAAYKFAFNHGDSYGRYSKDNVIKAFEEGIKWLLGNLWHESKEKPKVPKGEPCVTCLVKFKNESTELCTYWSESGWDCDEMSYKDFTKNFDGWLYVDELFK